MNIPKLYKLARDAHRIEPGLLLYSIISGLLRGISTVAGLLVIRDLINCIEINSLSNLSISLVITWLLSRLGTVFFLQEYKKHMFPAFLGFVKSVAIASIKMPYKNTLNPSFLSLASSAQMAVGGTGIGIHRVIDGFSIFFSELLNCIAAGYILGTGSIFIPIYCSLLLLFQIHITNIYKKKEVILQKEKDAQNRKEMNWFSILSDFSYGKEPRIYHAQSWLLQKYKNIQEKTVSLVKKTQDITIGYRIFAEVLVFIRDLGVAIYLVLQLINNNINVESCITVFIALRTFVSSAELFLTNIIEMNAQMTYVDSYYQYTEQTILEQEPQKKHLQDRNIAVGGDIVISNLSFTYPGSEKPVINNLSLSIRNGEKIAIVGENGAGKTTLIDLICKLYKPDSGSITLSDTNINDITDEEYYKKLGVVFQNSMSMAIPLVENISMKEMDDTNDKRIKELLQTFRLDTKIGQQYHSDVSKRFSSDGIEFSGGEESRLWVARALYKNPEILILDEPSSALDPIAEADLYLELSREANNRTIIFVSHRLSSVQFCDRIVYIEDGTIIEQGAHEELMEINGKYAKLYLKQSQMYVSEGDI